MREEPTLRAEEGGSSEVQNKILMEVEVEPLEERTATVVAQVGETMVESLEIPSPPSPEEENLNNFRKLVPKQCL
ncbi:hypothetical protein AXG93_1217s1380 [Marchantia polymorpha subsp. ruderalis]|uniref:Uncharacterized protein n=1 Tax=Marchantia polymorpha subsp. ruderalis TaxID=1480154 RepID=A0A176VVM7_MARPO|nr:hypothetical protein AXG93_1217s1380 [Marchantia polymorpha subsp. ruderalis]